MAEIDEQELGPKHQQVTADAAIEETDDAEQQRARKIIDDQIDLIARDSSIQPASKRDELVAKLLALRGGKISLADIANVLAEVKTEADHARAEANADRAEQFAELMHYASYHLNAHQSAQIEHYSRLTLDISDPQSVDAYARAMIDADVPQEMRAELVEVNKRLLLDPDQQEINAQINLASPEERRAVFTAIKQQDLYFRAAAQDPQLAAMSDEIRLARHLHTVTRGELAATIEKARKGEISAEEGAQLLHEKTESKLNQAGTDLSKLKKHLSPSAQNNIGSPPPDALAKDVDRAMTKSEQHKPLTRRDHDLVVLGISWDECKKRGQAAAILAQKTAQKTVEVTGEAIEYGGHKIDLATKQGKQMGAAYTAIYALDINNLNATPEQRVKLAQDYIKAHRSEYKDLDDATLELWSKKALIDTQHKRNDIRFAQRAAVIQLMADVDSSLPDEWQKDPQKRVERIQAALAASKLPTDHFAPSDMQFAQTEALKQAQQRRDAESRREQALVLQKAIAVDYALPDEAPGSDRASRVARIREALIRDKVPTAYIHAADLDKTIEAGLEQAQKNRNAESKREQEVVKRTAHDVSLQFGDIAHTDKALVNERIREALAKENIKTAYIHHDDLDKTIQKGVSDAKNEQGTAAVNNRNHNRHMAELERNAKAYRDQAKDAGKGLAGVAGSLAAHVDFDKEHRVTKTAAGIAQNIGEGAYNFMGGLNDVLRTGLKITHAPQHFTPKEVHDDIRDILKDPKQLAALMKDLTQSGVATARLHLTGNPEQDANTVVGLLNAGHKDMIKYNANKNEKLDEKELAAALSDALKAGATVPVQVAAGAHAVPGQQIASAAQPTKGQQTHRQS